MGTTHAATTSGFAAVLASFYEAEQRYVAAGGAKAGADFSEMASHLHPDVVGRQGPTVPYPGDWHGAEGLQRFFALFTETWSSLELSDIQYFEGETGLAIQMRMQATSVATGHAKKTPRNASGSAAASARTAPRPPTSRRTALTRSRGRSTA